MTSRLALASAVSMALAAATTGWFLLVLPFSVPAAFAAWLGLSNQELLDVLGGGGADADPGRGPAGWTP